MKSKRIIIIFSIIIFFAVAVVLTSVLFRVGDFSVIPVSDIFKESEAEKIKESLLLDYNGKSIFFLDEKSLTNKVETEFPYVEVVNIERRFPKEVCITVQERIEVYCFNIGKDYIYTDYSCKILRVEKNKDAIEEIYDESKYGQVIKVKVAQDMISNYKADEQNVGKILEFFRYGATKFLAELYLNMTNDPADFRKYIESVDITNFYIPDSYINGKQISGSVVEIKIETGAVFTFYKTSEYGEKFVRYLKALMFNNPDPVTGKQINIERIEGEYVIRYLDNKCVIEGGPFLIKP